MGGNTLISLSLTPYSVKKFFGHKESKTRKKKYYYTYVRANDAISARPSLNIGHTVGSQQALVSVMLTFGTCLKASNRILTRCDNVLRPLGLDWTRGETLSLCLWFSPGVMLPGACTCNSPTYIHAMAWLTPFCHQVGRKCRRIGDVPAGPSHPGKRAACL